MYLGGYRTIIEVKRSKYLKNGPHAANSGAQNETVFQQLTRMVEADRDREQTRLDEDRDSGWIGCITDSKRWWVWTWPANGGEPEQLLGFNGKVLNEQDKVELLKKFQQGTQWAPPKPYYLFESVLSDLETLYQQLKAGRETRIQRQLWLEQLRASGQPPEHVDYLFVRHTLLILIARLVGGIDDTNIGFVQWVPEDSSVLANLHNIIESYDWRNETGDILRSLYMDAIGAKNRILFGEFYTPDWLADKLCLDTIDDAFIQEQIDNYNADKPVQGVLDPACGSGTFLYHAARRILNSKPLRDSYLNVHSKREFVLNMIRGIDIHPVAVEMARANMGRLFPDAPSDSIHIHQGDSLLVTRPERTLHAVSEDVLVIYTPGKRQFMIPTNFLDDTEGIRAFVLSARDDRDMPLGLGHKLTPDERETLRENHHRLREVIREEGDGVWAWYIMNQASPLLLRKNKVGRIVSNPPWVQNNKIYDQTRKDEVEQLARDLKLWVGKNVTTSFDIAQLFVVRCSKLYLQKEGWSSWVLSHGALFSSAWENFRDISNEPTGRWDVERIPFQNTPTSVLFFGPKQVSGIMKKMEEGERLDEHRSWDTVVDLVEIRPFPSFPNEPSAWFDKKRTMAKQGATLVPYCFTKIDTIEHETYVTTHVAQKRQWKKFGSFGGEVPKEWIHNCMFFANLMPFLVSGITQCVLPIKKNKLDPDRMKNRLYKLMYDTYADNCGSGKGTPQDLDGQLDTRKKLSSQFDRKLPQVIYTYVC